MADKVELLGIKADVASSFLQRAKGLIGRSSLPPGEGLLIERCNAIHTFFMKFPIDAIFLDRRGRVVKMVRNIRPWRFLVWGGWRAVKVLEVVAGERREEGKGKREEGRGKSKKGVDEEA